MPIERALLDILACPIDKQGLLYFEDEGILYNPRLRRVYRMADDHLVMLAGRAESATEQEHDRLVKRARHGDGIGTSGMSGCGTRDDRDAGNGDLPRDSISDLTDPPLLSARCCLSASWSHAVVMMPCLHRSDTTSSDQYHTSNLHNPR